MHYNFVPAYFRDLGQAFDSSLQNPGCRPPPAGMQERDAAPGRYQIDRDAIGNGHGEQRTRRGREPSVDAIDLQPPAAGAGFEDLRTVNLSPQDNELEGGLG